LSTQSNQRSRARQQPAFCRNPRSGQWPGSDGAIIRGARRPRARAGGKHRLRCTAVPRAPWRQILPV